VRLVLTAHQTNQQLALMEAQLQRLPRKHAVRLVLTAHQTNQQLALLPSTAPDAGFPSLPGRLCSGDPMFVYAPYQIKSAKNQKRCAQTYIG